MSSIGTGYDLSASQFSPDGRVFQIEYAAKAVENSSTAVGLRSAKGVVFAVEKIVTSKLHEDDAGTRIFTIDEGIGLTLSGMMSDGRAVVEIARDEAANYRRQYNVPIPTKILNERLSSYFHAYTLYSAIRPFGVSIMLSSWSEKNGAELYMIEPSGVSCGYFGCAIGKAKQAAKTEIEKIRINERRIDDLLNDASKIIYQVHDQTKDKEFLLELSYVGEETEGKHTILRKSTEQYKKANDFGKNSLDQDGAGSDDE